MKILSVETPPCDLFSCVCSSVSSTQSELCTTLMSMQYRESSGFLLKLDWPIVKLHDEFGDEVWHCFELFHQLFDLIACDRSKMNNKKKIYVYREWEKRKKTQQFPKRNSNDKVVSSTFECSIPFLILHGISFFLNSIDISWLINFEYELEKFHIQKRRHVAGRTYFQGEEYLTFMLSLF